MNIIIDKNDYIMSQRLIDEYAAPILTVSIDPIVGMNIKTDSDIWIPMDNATTVGKTMSIVGEFLTAAFGILFIGGKWSKPGIFKMIKLGYLSFKMIRSVVEAIKK